MAVPFRLFSVYIYIYTFNDYKPIGQLSNDNRSRIFIFKPIKLINSTNYMMRIHSFLLLLFLLLLLLCNRPPVLSHFSYSWGSIKRFAHQLNDVANNHELSTYNEWNHFGEREKKGEKKRFQSEFDLSTFAGLWLGSFQTLNFQLNLRFTIQVCKNIIFNNITLKL